MTPNLNHALELAAQSFAVFPVYWMAAPGVCACKDGAACDPKSQGKHPITPRGHNDASTDPKQIETWWGLAPMANVGVSVPDGYCVVDVDPRNGGEATFEELERTHGFPSTRSVVTGGGGAHFWYRLPEGWALPGRLGEGVDLKQKGGYVLAPPSNHSSGGVYSWASSPLATIVEAPVWLVALGHKRSEGAAVIVEDEDRVATDAELDTIVAAVEPAFVDGKKHHVAKNLAGWMKQRGFGLADAVEVMERLPSQNPKAKVKAAVAAYRIEQPFGWRELKGLLGDAVAAHLDASTPNPRRARELADRASADALLPAFAAGAVPSRSVGVPVAPVPTGDALAALGNVRDLSKPPAPLDYLVAGLELAPGRCSMVAGYSNVGKTVATQALAFAVAMGHPVWGKFRAKCTKVIHCDWEAGDVVLENYTRLANAAGVSNELLADRIHVIDMSILITASDIETKLVEAIRSRSAGLVVIDVLRAAAAGVDENKAEITVPLYALRRVSVATGATILVLHHEKKPNEDKRGQVEHMISGHAGIHGSLQAALSLVRDKASGNVDVYPSKKIRKGFKPFRLKIVDVSEQGRDISAQIVRAGEPSWGLKVEVANEEHEEKTPALDPILDAQQKILALLRLWVPDGGQVRWSSVVVESKARQGVLSAARDRLVRSGQIRMVGNAPIMISLVKGASDMPSNVPAPLPSVRESLDAMGDALRAEHEGHAAE